MDRILCLIIKVIVFFSKYTKALASIGIGTYDEYKSGQQLKILLVGYNGARNTGADARVVAIVKQLKELYQDTAKITVMTLSKDTVEGYFDEDVKLLEFSSIFLLDLYRACCTHHVAILCEGSTLKSTFANALTLFFCEASGIMANQNKPCIAYGSEVGQMESFLKRTASKLCKKTYFITRTKEAYDRLKELGLEGHTGTDTAWCYDKAITLEEAETLLKNAGWDGKKKIVGAAVIDPFCWPVRASMLKWVKSNITGDFKGQYDKWYYFSDSRKRQEAYFKYIDAFAYAINKYQKENDCFVVLLGMEKLDAKACNMLKGKLERTSGMFLSGQCSADIMVGVLRKFSLLVTSRYHAAVLSMEKKLPIIAVSMDERLDGIMREVSLGDDYLFRVSENQLGEKIYCAMKMADDNRLNIAEKINAQRKSYEDKLYAMGQFLVEYVGGRL